MISGSLYALIKEKWRLVQYLTHTLRRGEIAFHYPGEFHWVKANGKIAPNLIVISFFLHRSCDGIFQRKDPSPRRN